MNRIIKLNRVLNFRNLSKIAHINSNLIVQPSLNRNFNFNQCYRFASTIGTGTTVDPAETEAFEQMEEGTRLLNEGDVDGAKKHYERSLDIRTTAMGLFNLGVTQFYEKDISSAIASWEQSIKLYPSNADAHTNIASAHILSSPSNPEKALHHLKRAQHLSPEDGEITFNLAVVSEATGNLNDAYDNYQKAKSLGVERAEENIRNVGAKLLSEKVKANESNK